MASHFLARLESGDRFEGMYAKLGLGVMEDIGAVDPLIETLQDEDVRAVATAKLCRIGDERALTYPIDALSVEDAGVRSAAASSLERIGNSRALKPFSSTLA